MDSDYDVKNLYQVDKTSLEETREKLDWCKREFGYAQKIHTGLKIDMILCIYIIV